ncbi:hypothetical protein Q3G72_025354 [Acer saccharum]|nr:hypothetical protein Q3G72_025354 [Acer saccharum]
MTSDIVFDIILVENQLPLFILEDLFILAKPYLPDPFKEYSLSRFACIFFEYHVCRAVPIPLSRNITFMESYYAKAKHFIDLIRLCLEPPNRDDTLRYLADSEAAPNITRLHQSGIKFKTASVDKNLFDIQFISEKKELVIPKLVITNLTVHVLRNLRIFEELHCDTNFMNDYGAILHRLLSTLKDVELLSETGVIENRVLDDQGLLTLFEELCRDARVDIDYFYYSGLVKDLQSYCESRRHRWKAYLKQNYFNNPWISISVIGAIIMLAIEFIKTVCTVIALLQ